MAIGHVVTRGYGTGTFVGEIRQIVIRGFFDSAVIPELVDPIHSIAVPADSGSYVYAFEGYFVGETSFSIAPAVEAGWSFDTNTGELTIDTDAAALFGPYTVTATNSAGSTDSNPFTVNVATSAGLPSRGLNLRLGLGL